jgi:DUF296 family protein family protein
MKTKQLHQAGPRTFAVVFDKDDEVIEGLTAFTREHAIAAAQITAIGAFKAVTLGFFDPDAMDYKKFALPEQVEVFVPDRGCRREGRGGANTRSCRCRSLRWEYPGQSSVRGSRVPDARAHPHGGAFPFEEESGGRDQACAHRTLTPRTRNPVHKDETGRHGYASGPL